MIDSPRYIKASTITVAMEQASIEMSRYGSTYTLTTCKITLLKNSRSRICSNFHIGDDLGYEDQSIDL